MAGILIIGLYGHLHLYQLQPYQTYVENRFERSNDESLGMYAPILMYHHIADRPKQEPYYVSPQVFEQQMKWLKDNGYQVISFDQFYAGIKNPGSLPAKPVVITFDDGDADQYNNAFPVLKKYGYTATFYIVTGQVGARDYMSWSQLTDLVKSGMSIEAHSVTHPNLAHLRTSKIDEELRDSKKTLEDKLGIKVIYMAYPGGSFDGRVIASAQRNGYLSAVDTIHSVYHSFKYPTDYYSVSRIHIDNDMVSFIKLVEGQPESLIEK